MSDIRLIYPVSGPITQYFGENPKWYEEWGYPGHNGIDWGIPNGTPVLGAQVGKIDKIANEAGGYGLYLVISHEAGEYFTYYAHLQCVYGSVGEEVGCGEAVAASNNSGNSTGPHLHFGLRIPGTNPEYKGYVDPLPYFSSGGCDGDQPPVEPPQEQQLLTVIPGRYQVTVETLNVRKGPSTTYPLADQVTQGEVLEVVGAVEPGSLWAQLQDGNFVAMIWYGAHYLEKID